MFLKAPAETHILPEYVSSIAPTETHILPAYVSPKAPTETQILPESVFPKAPTETHILPEFVSPKRFMFSYFAILLTLAVWHKNLLYRPPVLCAGGW